MFLKVTVTAISVLVIMSIYGNAFAVGYERVISPEYQGVNKPPTQQSQKNGPVSYVKNKIPGMLDETAFMVKDFLGQFGLIQTKDRPETSEVKTKKTKTQK